MYARGRIAKWIIDGLCNVKVRRVLSEMLLRGGAAAVEFYEEQVV